MATTEKTDRRQSTASQPADYQYLNHEPNSKLCDAEQTYNYLSLRSTALGLTRENPRNTEIEEGDKKKKRSRSGQLYQLRESPEPEGKILDLGGWPTGRPEIIGYQTHWRPGDGQAPSSQVCQSRLPVDEAEIFVARWSSTVITGLPVDEVDPISYLPDHSDSREVSPRTLTALSAPAQALFLTNVHAGYTQQMRSQSETETELLDHSDSREVSSRKLTGSQRCPAQALFLTNVHAGYFRRFFD
ncbi:hypothetical protein RRG08_030210 [Elysia crispata]|uniref:Uncharacterized protein n=1 Tax=Elysia crispata TaxID=231223 RepID=A0AAE1E3Y6_9GAST|nr:hypothetical protein RRG08_030210 [Elysia crispata]